MKELLALERALVVLGPSLHTGTLLGKVAAQMAIVNQGSNKSEQLCKLMVRTLKWAERLHISIEPVQLSSEVKPDY